MARGRPSITGSGLVGVGSSGGIALGKIDLSTFWLKVTERIAVTGDAPDQYKWKQVIRERNGDWKELVTTGGPGYDPAFEVNDQRAIVGNVYRAIRDPNTGQVLFVIGSGGGGGAVEIKSGETVLMILGDYETYKDCPDVPPKPPTTWTDGCQTARSSTLCVPAYAYAVYQRCGYLWNKVGDTRDFGVWANEINGQSFGAWRRLVIPRWGGDVDPATGLPDPESECMGVAFLGAGAGSALTCSCPSCLTTPPEGVELCLKFRTIPRPEDPEECGPLVTAMDAESAWDREYVVPLTKASGFCSVGGETEDGIFTVGWDWQDGTSLSCDWGPEVLDPCDPCEHWGRIFATIASNYGGSEPNCGAGGVWTGEFKSKDVCAIVCDCGNGPVAPVEQKHCNGCGNNETPPAIWNAVLEGSVEIVCCSTGVASDFVAGGTPGSLPTDFIAGGTPGSLPGDFIEGSSF